MLSISPKRIPYFIVLFSNKKCSGYSHRCVTIIKCKLYKGGLSGGYFHYFAKGCDHWVCILLVKPHSPKRDVIKIKGFTGSLDTTGIFLVFSTSSWLNRDASIKQKKAHHH